jgi:DNA-binding NtrC family response regulator
MTAYGTTQTAIEAMKLGAYDYLLKPFDIPKLKEIVGNALKAARDMKQVVSYEPLAGIRGLRPRHRRPQRTMQQVFKLIGQVAASDATALITGESGTGKELVARAIYHHSNRSEQPFLAVNCAAIPEQLLESELFGHEKGSFTGATNQRVGKFEQCNKGTIFLDEIGDMTPPTQTKILRVLQSGTFERVGGNSPIQVDVRVIAATNKPLEAAVAARQFREDLFYRLNVVRIHIPPLRDRREDIPLLVNYFLKKFAPRTAARPQIHRRQRHPRARKISLARQHPRIGKRHPPRPCHGQERRHSARRFAARNFRPAFRSLHAGLEQSSGRSRLHRRRRPRAPALSMGQTRSQTESHPRR